MRSEADGQGRFGVLCNLHHDNYREGYPTFQVKAGDASNDSGSGDNPAAGTNNSNVQGPSSGGGLVWLLLPASLLLLIALAAWLRLRQATARRAGDEAPRVSAAATAPGPGTTLEVDLIDLLTMRLDKQPKVPRVSSSSSGVKWRPSWRRAGSDSTLKD